MKFFRNQIGLCFNSKLIITLFHQLSIAFVCCTTPCYLLSLFVIYWHSLYHSLSFALPIVAIRFQLLRFVVIRCTTCSDSLSIDVPVVQFSVYFLFAYSFFCFCSLFYKTLYEILFSFCVQNYCFENARLMFQVVLLLNLKFTDRLLISAFILVND